MEMKNPARHRLAGLGIVLAVLLILTITSYVPVCAQTTTPPTAPPPSTTTQPPIILGSTPFGMVGPTPPPTPPLIYVFTFGGICLFIGIGVFIFLRSKRNR